MPFGAPLAFGAADRFRIAAEMQTAELNVRDPPLIDVVLRSDAAIHFAIHKTEMDLYGLLKREAVARGLVSCLGHVWPPIGDPDQLDMPSGTHKMRVLPNDSRKSFGACAVETKAGGASPVFVGFGQNFTTQAAVSLRLVSESMLGF